MFALFFGAPGVGKGTQAELVAQRLHAGHLSTGDAFRTAIKKQTEIGRKAQGYVDAGELVPDDVVTGIVSEALELPQFSNNIILDGFPRNLAQAKELDRLLDGGDRRITHVINIIVEQEEIVKRLLERGRKDDTIEVIRHRLTVYQEQTEPLLDYYSKADGLLHNVEGNDGIETVFGRIEQILR